MVTVKLSPLVAAVGILAALASGTASAGSVPEVTYYFSGNCTDCALEANTSTYAVWATLTLTGYVEGQAIAVENFVSFEYSGSNLIDPYTVAFLPPVLASRAFNAETISEISGSLGDAAANGQSFSMRFDDGLFFRTLANGTWSTCAPKGNVYYGGNSCFSVGADMGTGSWSTSPVPEPAGYVLLATGMLGLALRRRLVAASA